MNIYVVKTKITILIFLKTMIVLRVSVSVPEIMSISWIDHNKIIMFLVLVYVINQYLVRHQVLIEQFSRCVFLFRHNIKYLLQELSGAKESLFYSLKETFLQTYLTHIFLSLELPCSSAGKN